jgi:hypothetical protein
MVVCSLNICFVSHSSYVLSFSAFHHEVECLFILDWHFVMGLVFLLAAARGELPAAAVDFRAGPFCFLARPREPESEDLSPV